MTDQAALACPRCGAKTERWDQPGRPTPAIRCPNGHTWNIEAAFDIADAVTDAVWDAAEGRSSSTAVRARDTAWTTALRDAVAAGAAVELGGDQENQMTEKLTMAGAFNSTFPTVRRAVATITCRDEERIVPESRLAMDLGCDSLDIIEIVMEVEKALNIDIPDESLDQVETVGDLTRLVYRG